METLRKPRRARSRCLLVLAASTALMGGGLLPSAPAFPAAATSHSATAAGRDPLETVVPARDWMETKDLPSGITVELPGRATLEEDELPVDGETVTMRAYELDTPDGGVAFIVHDVPGGQRPLDDYLKAFLTVLEDDFGGSALTIADVKKSTLDGRPVLDARLVPKDGGDHAVALTRYIGDGDHVVQVLTLGDGSKEKAMAQTQERVRSSIRFPDAESPAAG